MIIRKRSGCILRYVPDEEGERVDRSGRRFRKLDFEPAYALIEEEKPQYSDLVQRIPHRDIKRVLKPELEIPVDDHGATRVFKNSLTCSGFPQVQSDAPVHFSVGWKSRLPILTWSYTENTGLLHKHWSGREFLKVK